MGLFFTTYKVLKNEGMIFDNWVTVISNLSLKEAEKYVKDKTSGLFSDSKDKYKIEKE
ncbi:hypothetical protein [Enterococcus sp. LJL90]